MVANDAVGLCPYRGGTHLVGHHGGVTPQELLISFLIARPHYSHPGRQSPRSAGFKAAESFFHCGVNPSGAFPRKSAFDVPSSRQFRRDQALFALLGANHHFLQSQYLLGRGNGNRSGFHGSSTIPAGVRIQMEISGSRAIDLTDLSGQSPRAFGFNIQLA